MTTLLPTLKLAYSLLPPAMESPEATQMLLAIGHQESRFRHRKQVGGPAHGFWQFEKNGGVLGVLGHIHTAPRIRVALRALQYPDSSSIGDCYAAIVHNDVLAACFARLLLYTHPMPLPALTDPNGGWMQYIHTWRPGKPHPETWAEAWAFATSLRESLPE